MVLNKVKNIDVLECMYGLPDNSFDLIIVDAPAYKIVKDKWDHQWKNLYAFSEWMLSVIIECERVLNHQGSLYIHAWIGKKNPVTMAYILDDSDEFTELILQDVITWAKQRGHGNRRGWMYAREELLWYTKSNDYYWNPEYQYSTERRAYDILKNGHPVNKSPFKRLTNVWTDILEVGFGTSPAKQKKVRAECNHSTPKPQLMYDRIIKAHTQENDKVLIPFSGSGPAVKSCIRLNRNYLGIDNNRQEAV